MSDCSLSISEAKEKELLDQGLSKYFCNPREFVRRTDEGPSHWERPVPRLAVPGRQRAAHCTNPDLPVRHTEPTQGGLCAGALTWPRVRTGGKKCRPWLFRQSTPLICLTKMSQISVGSMTKFQREKPSARRWEEITGSLFQHVYRLTTLNLDRHIQALCFRPCYNYKTSDVGGRNDSRPMVWGVFGVQARPL